MPHTEIILRENGSLIERTTQERVLDAGPSVLEALTQNLHRTSRHVLHLPEWGAVHANVSVDDTLWTVAIHQLPLHARFRVSNEVLVPAFSSNTEVEMALNWQAPANVRLALAILTRQEESEVEIMGNWLFACDDDNRGYRLPLPNLHDDCRICTGEFPTQYPSAAAAVQASVEQFRKSKWNSDLMRTVEQSQKCFRFKPQADGFETLPIDAPDWTLLCDKVSTEILERVVL